MIFLNWLPRRTPDPADEHALDRIASLLAQLVKQGLPLMTDLATATADLTQAAAALTSAVNAAIPEIQALATQNKALADQLAAAVASNDGTAIEAIAQQFTATASDLKAAADAAAPQAVSGAAA